MWEQCVVLEDVPDGSPFARDPYARGRVVEHVAVDGERSEADADASVETHAGNQRSRSDTSTTTDTASSTRLSAIAPPRLVWSSTKIASGMVCVSPWRFPANRIVAPNSPSARAHVSAAPATSDGAISGSTTRRKVVKPRAPSVAAASS